MKNFKTYEEFLNKFAPMAGSGNRDYNTEGIDESIVTEANPHAKPAGLTKDETMEVAQRFADAMSKADGKKVTVNKRTLEEDSFDLDVDGEEFDGGSYNIFQNGNVMNMALRNNPVYGKKNDSVDTIVNNMKKMSESVNESFENPLEAFPQVYKDLLKKLQRSNDRGERFMLINKMNVIRKKLKLKPLTTESVVTEAKDVKSDVIDKLSQFFNVSTSALIKFKFDGKDDIRALTKALNGTDYEGVDNIVRVAILSAKRDLGIEESIVTEAKDKHDVLDSIENDIKKGNIQKFQITDEDVWYWASKIKAKLSDNDVDWILGNLDESVVTEGAMSELDIIAKEAKDFKSFVKEFKKEFKNMDAGSPKELEAWLQTIYDSAKESVYTQVPAKTIALTEGTDLGSWNQGGPKANKNVLITQYVGPKDIEDFGLGRKCIQINVGMDYVQLNPADIVELQDILKSYKVK
jgi:hypothetical protein